MLPTYFFVKRQVKNVKGVEANFSPTGGWPTVIGWFKTMKEARAAVDSHKASLKIENSPLPVTRVIGITYKNLNWEVQCVNVDILPSLKEGDSYGVLQILQNRFGRYFRPVWMLSRPFARHSRREYCLWELALRNRDILAHRHVRNLAHGRILEKRRANDALKDGVCTCP